MIYKVSVVLLVLAVVVSATVEMNKEETRHKKVKREKHGKQEPYTEDGKENPHYIHETIIGDPDEEAEFDDLTPEESKARLRLLAHRMDTDHDGLVSTQELSDWIIDSFKRLDDDEAAENHEELDANKDGKLSWDEYVVHYNLTERGLKTLRQKGDKENEELIKTLAEDEEKFAFADQNKDGKLDKVEYMAFYHPSNYKHMHQFELDYNLKTHDLNKDGKLSFDEFAKDANEEALPEEKEHFKDLDKDNDGFLGKHEFGDWVIEDYQEDAMDEAEELIEHSDMDENELLTEKEILDAYQKFVGSSATGHGSALRKEDL